MGHKYPPKHTAQYDVFTYLVSEEHIEEYLETIRESNDPALLQQAMEHVCLARERMAAA